jgi:tetratricopeptide (TPR) repeat protein
LAASHFNIGNLLRDTGRLDEALKAYNEALSVFERLASNHPGVPAYQSGLAATLNQIALLDMGRRAWPEARERLRLAVAHQRAALAAQPQNANYIHWLKRHYTFLTSVEREMRNADAAIRAAHDLSGLSSGDPAGTYDFACTLAICIAIARIREQQELADEAMKALRVAVAAGWRKPWHMARDPDLAPLHGRDDFERFLAELFDRVFPADPFTR